MARSIALAVVLLAGCTPSSDGGRPAFAAPTTTTQAPPAPTSTASDVSTTSVAVTTAPLPGPDPAPVGGAVDQEEGMPGQDVTLACIRHWESRGNYRAVSRSGRYRGAYQFDQATYTANGGTGDPAAASVEDQDQAAATLLARRGLEPWPTPARRCA